MKLGYVILYVPSVADAVDFYESAFGLECRFRHGGIEGDYAEMETGQTALAFVSETLADSHGFGYRKTNVQSEAPSIEVALVTDDVSAAYDRAIAAGAIAVKAPAQQPWGQTISYVRDNNGYLVEICSPVAK
ncbi:Glyoxalase-like domain protein [Rubripirellula lacrimiformis]|uniref:Glyoxalase-like domain protein n=1 Tax=Rubripirellula lacrimiformis TaxID=1930273 RepID=A0A517NCV5_9BACT|nr:VOC family protein [Rubripirellula lacrimiformis]QDT04941.1 Glyoxalase-like domain protein [Rubripirellula lacrimiformis]